MGMIVRLSAFSFYQAPHSWGFLFVRSWLDFDMKCISCSHNWKRTKIKEYFSFLSNCPSCGSHFVARNDMVLAIYTFFKKIIN